MAADVTRAQARLQSAAARVGQADRALRTAIITFNGNFEGLQQTTRFGDVLVLVYRPQEVVFALQLMKLAFDEYFTTVADYNRAQFELFHALGYPAREITYLRPPGNIVPVDTERPAYLRPGGQWAAAGNPLKRRRFLMVGPAINQLKIQCDRPASFSCPGRSSHRICDISSQVSHDAT